MASSSRTKRIRYSGEQVAEIVTDSGSDFDDLNEDSNSDEEYSLIGESEQETEADLDSDDFENIDNSAISNSNSNHTSNDDFSTDVTQPNPAKNVTRGHGRSRGSRRTAGRSRGRGRQTNNPEQRDRKTYVWLKATRQPEVQNFLGTPGPTQQCNVVDVDNVMGNVTLFLPEEFFNILVSETNLYAQQYFERVGVLQQYSRATAWFPVTKDEIKTFIGLPLLTGLVDKKGDIAKYWIKEKTLATPFFNATMSRNRYQLISRFLHCSDNNSRPANCT